MRSVGLFSGIGGMELGLQEAGHKPVLLCELMPAARMVLKERFPDVELTDDIRDLESLPRCDVVTAGFPCTDLSSVGRAVGIYGKDSRLVREVFRLAGEARFKPRWLVFENVPFMLTLKKGAAMKLIVGQLEAMGYSWAYRVVDARAFGVPQRRRRVLIVASRIQDPRSVLLGIDAGQPQRNLRWDTERGFYWTEGNTGLGWAPGAIPTLKGGSGFGIASPPAIWFPARQSIEMPSIRDAERLQGFSVDWTSCIGEEHRPSIRWKMVGKLRWQPAKYSPADLRDTDGASR